MRAIVIKYLNADLKSGKPSAVFQRTLKRIKATCTPLYEKPSADLNFQQCWYQGDRLMANTYHKSAAKDSPALVIQLFHMPE